MKNFALIGAAGFIAPKHMRAIKDTHNLLVVAHDKHDSVGILDSYFPTASFFTEYERFDRFLEKQRHKKDGQPVDYVSICSPNYLHDAHCRLALRIGAHAICEKPLVINPWNLDQLSELEQLHGKKVFNVLQLRHHAAVQKLKSEFADRGTGAKTDICLTYVTRRGKWYHYAWKGDITKSGGVTMNIGIHFFDFLSWVFGDVESSQVHLAQASRCSGVLELATARVKWFLSVEESDLPRHVMEQDGYAYRSITCDGQEIDLSAGFADLHTKVYEHILSGDGFGIEDARHSIELVYKIRQSQVVSPGQGAHPMLKRV